MFDKITVDNTPVSFIFWCTACLEKHKEGESARCYLDCKPYLVFEFNIQDLPYFERELSCPHCGGQSFHVSICGGTEE